MATRIAKAIADAGVCSRREAEKLLSQGRVLLNGNVQTSPAINVTKADTISVDGRPLKWVAKPLRVFAYNKPAGVLCTNTDPQNRRTVFDTLPKKLPRLVLVGRLDLNSEGLLLLTNKGDFAGELMHPKHGLERVYKVRFHGDLTPNQLEKMAQPLTIDGVRYRPLKIKLLPSAHQGTNKWAQVRIIEGKNREIRKVFEHFNVQVNRLIRLSYGGIDLGTLPLGKIKELTPAQVQTLQAQINPTQKQNT